jgi:hypothetical protein
MQEHSAVPIQGLDWSPSEALKIALGMVYEADWGTPTAVVVSRYDPAEGARVVRGVGHDIGSGAVSTILDLSIRSSGSVHVERHTPRNVDGAFVESLPIS